MSFGWSAATWMAITAATAVATTAYTVDNSRKTSNKANDLAKANALKNQQAQDEANNRANARGPDSSALMAANMLAAKAGQSGTMLTGPSGVDPTSLTLGKTSLIGGGG